MNRAHRIWIAFALGLAVVLAAMAWTSMAAVRLHRAEARANRQAAVQEKVRLALWRMDSSLTPLIAQEAARPYFAYSAFHPIDRAYTRMFAEVEPNAIMVPSPLLAGPPGQVILHFQFAPGGELTSPQAPTGNQRDLAETGYVTHEQITAAGERLAKLTAAVRQPDLSVCLPGLSADRFAIVSATQPDNLAARPGPAWRTHTDQQQALNINESQQRYNIVQQNAGLLDNERSARRSDRSSATNQFSEQVVIEGPMQALWANGLLLLARRISVGGQEYVQGCWLDWDAIRKSLASHVVDLLPHAQLLAAPRPADGNGTDLLAAIPARLIPGPVPLDGDETVWPVAAPLAIAWGCLLAGTIAVAVVLHATISLSERRGAFVSAVSHELRTPLTTFRLYAELLAAGAITDEARRGDYLRRLKDESDRLAHLVENVLSYARLSGRGSSDQAERVTVGDLLERSRDRLSARAAAAGMRLMVDCLPAAAEVEVLVNVASVEQIIANLVDNACKYAAGSAEPTIHLEGGVDGSRAIISVRDHGPGISRPAARRLFRPFSKSASQAAGSAPGVGLGLALSRRLARKMNGDLRLASPTGQPASFVLSLHISSPRTPGRSR